ncbi:Stealth CR1 domain-containing protein [Gottfriedia sp. NPDC056225]|uniref:Stealth CR1 domain-containing protein n=1 Tax=Gottfriedia sp. NPDC056225 TaxID=3345751 RepID=UPI0035D94C58
MEQKIDFVIPWVDGNDILWQKERNNYSDNPQDFNSARFRDWDLLRYWFRGVEKFTPWVNKIYFISWGHLPEWLNTNNPKLVVVNHKDYIPSEYLPTFSSHTIELNIHRIKNLSEQFVYFNDDMFIINLMKKEDFFRKGLPCDSAILNNRTLNHKSKFVVPFVNDAYINKHFKLFQVFGKQPLKWLSPKYGVYNYRNILSLPWNRFAGFYDFHIPYSYTKRLFKEVWNEEGEILEKTCLNKFRNDTDVNQWLVRYWNLAKGTFHPRSIKTAKLLDYDSMSLSTFEYTRNVENVIKNQKYKMVCINDSPELDFEIAQPILKNAFEDLLYDKSSFEI